jgi:hypothetical protein
VRFEIPRIDTAVLAEGRSKYRYSVKVVPANGHELYPKNGPVEVLKP